MLREDVHIRGQKESIEARKCAHLQNTDSGKSGAVERHVLITAVKRKAEENADAPPMKLIRRELRASDFSNLVDGDLVRVSCI